MYVYEDTGRLSSISSQSSAVRDEIQKIFNTKIQALCMNMLI
jgi:hypothetical protein